jgi:hypothetical protein
LEDVISATAEGIGWSFMTGLGFDLMVDDDNEGTGRGWNATGSGTLETAAGAAFGAGAEKVDALRALPGLGITGSGEADTGVSRDDVYPATISRVLILRVEFPTLASFSAAPRDAEPRIEILSDEED